jgi:RNA recognition motif-containing protein
VSQGQHWPSATAVPMSTTLYLNNLPPSATDETLGVKFGQFGTVVSARVNRDPATGRSLGSGTVEMQTPGSAQAAIERLNLADYDGRLMSVRRAAHAAKALN